MLQDFLKTKLDDTAQLLASQVRVQIDAYTLKVFKVPMWLVRNKFMWRWYAKMFDCKVLIEGGGLNQVYKFFKLGEKVGELHIAQTIIRSEVEGGNPIVNLVYKAFCEFLEIKMKFGIEPLTGFPCELSEEQRKHERDVAWGEFEQILKKYLK